MDNIFYESHDNFFKVITKRKLNELYKRSDPSTKILETDINNLLKNIKCKVNINNDCHIFINFFDLNNIQIGHITFHIEPKNRTLGQRSKQLGRFHIKNNIKTSNAITLKLNKSVDDRKLYVYYKIGTFGAILNDAVIITLNILNEYFDSDSPISLGKYNLKYIHKCTNIIINKMKARGLTIKNTRKRH